MKAFISHISRHKRIATRLKASLAKYKINGFVAHEYIHPTLEWQAEIERGLSAMDVLIAIHTEGFSQSNYTQQEVGFALGRGVKIISFEMGEQPTGFISRKQSLPWRRRLADEIAAEINVLLSQDERTKGKIEVATTPTFDLDEDIPF